MRVPGSVHTSVCPTVCQHSRRLPNCLPTSPKMAQPSANICIAELFANIAKDRPTVCKHFWGWPNFLLTLPNCLPSMSYTGQLFASFAEHRPTVLPTSCHSDHQIKSVRFLFGFLFFSFRNSVVLCFLFFHRLSAGSFIYLNDGSGNFGNLNMNGECIVRLYFFMFWLRLYPSFWL